MFWETLWPLILGFTLSGAVQAFVSRDQLQRVMGDHRARSVARASGLGMVSSSCSYAATAMSKSLFQKGADFTTAMIFMFASTNLVLELGIVLVVLMGWQFAAAEFVGGPIMIVLLALTGSLVVDAADGEAGPRPAPSRSDGRRPRPLGDGRRQRRAPGGARTDPVVEEAPLPRRVVRRRELHGRGPHDAAPRARDRVRDRRAVDRARADERLERRVPPRARLAHVVENVIVGPFIAIISFVCSIGNVPMAAALWHGGISFGGVIAFIFADLITLPLLLIYRKYYGTRLMLRLLVWFWAVMAVAGLAVEIIFDTAGLIPTDRNREVVETSFHWNYTTFLNLVFLAIGGYLYWLYRNRERFGGGDGLRARPGVRHAGADAPRARDPHPRRPRPLLLLGPLRRALRCRARRRPPRIHMICTRW